MTGPWISEYVLSRNPGWRCSKHPILQWSRRVTRTNIIKQLTSDNILLLWMRATRSLRLYYCSTYIILCIPHVSSVIFFHTFVIEYGSDCYKNKSRINLGMSTIRLPRGEGGKCHLRRHAFLPLPPQHPGIPLKRMCPSTITYLQYIYIYKRGILAVGTTCDGCIHVFYMCVFFFLVRYTMKLCVSQEVFAAI